MSDFLCGECWLEHGDVVCTMPEEHFKSKPEELKNEQLDEEQLDLFKD
jgi:hypothetical protein